MKIYVKDENIVFPKDLKVQFELSEERHSFLLHNSFPDESEPFVHPLFPKEKYWKYTYKRMEKFIETDSLADIVEIILSNDDSVILTEEILYEQVVDFGGKYRFENKEISSRIVLEFYDCN